MIAPDKSPSINAARIKVEKLNIRSGEKVICIVPPGPKQTYSFEQPSLEGQLPGGSMIRAEQAGLRSSGFYETFFDPVQAAAPAVGKAANTYSPRFDCPLTIGSIIQRQ
jgi:hypothetical protein